MCIPSVCFIRHVLLWNGTECMFYTSCTAVEWSCHVAVLPCAVLLWNDKSM